MVPETPPELAPLCGHGRGALRRDGYRLRCTTCGSFFDRNSLRREFVYDASYPADRGHFDRDVGAMKVRSLERWLAQVELDPSGRVVCEVGFGGGHCLRWLADRAAQTFGIEAVVANLEHARRLGVESVLAFDECRAPLPRPVELWFFQDSFEHLPEPRRFLSWLVASSAPRARVFVVAPEAGSRSERWLGAFWPHRLPDHRFHWSRNGIEELFRAHGFRTVAEFRPTKTVSGAMLLNHLSMTFPLVRPLAGAARWLRRLRLDFNVGEMGLVLEREAPITRFSGAATLAPLVHPS
jgi:Methyltransferase domain